MEVCSLMLHCMLSDGGVFSNVTLHFEWWKFVHKCYIVFLVVYEESKRFSRIANASVCIKLHITLWAQLRPKFPFYRLDRANVAESKVRTTSCPSSCPWTSQWAWTLLKMSLFRRGWTWSTPSHLQTWLTMQHLRSEAILFPSISNKEKVKLLDFVSEFRERGGWAIQRLAYIPRCLGFESRRKLWFRISEFIKCA